MSKRAYQITIAGVLISLIVFVSAYYIFAPRQEAGVTEVWDVSASNNAAQISHEVWQQVLDDYLVTDTESGINLFDYQGLIDDEETSLNDYIKGLADIDPRHYNRDEQFAYWVNLYNALTIKVVIDHYPVESIKQIGESPLPLGPWNDFAITIAGHDLTLNHIEHSILRPVWQDYRIHFAVNCASIGCPDLQGQAFTASNLNVLLDTSTVDFLTHPRGIHLEAGELTLSSIFSWYAQDFGENESAILSTLMAHIPAEQATQLAAFKGSIEYQYDWALNEWK